ncbi:MAG TPA: septal ring lytic transglycosylase RlpA family protein [Candidatus Aminicenantes bacterium]|nr:septal ring lytic transglycosylase RlpA family protein [Candidatus Aminicenantes bacterium]
MHRLIILFATVLLLVTACAPQRHMVREPVAPVAGGHTMEGTASWYGEKFHGRRTANGEIYDMHLLTAAHKTLPFHTLVRVTRLDSGRTVMVRINDRGPFVAGRIVDLSFAAARRLGMTEDGTAVVRLEAVSADLPLPPPPAAGVRVQAGAFSICDNALVLVRKLSAAFGVEFAVESENGIHRVFSPLLKRGDAEILCRRLRAAGIEAFMREAF